MIKVQSLLSGILLFGSVMMARSQAVPVPPGGLPVMAAPVSVSLTTDKKSYGQKDPIKLTFVVKNPRKSPVKLTFNSGMKYDFEIRKGKSPSGEKVWQWSPGHMFFQMVTVTSVEPGKALTFSETFAAAEKGPDGKPVAELTPGTYTATGILEVSGRAPHPMASATFTVK